MQRRSGCSLQLATMTSCALHIMGFNIQKLMMDVANTVLARNSLIGMGSESIRHIWIRSDEGVYSKENNSCTLVGDAGSRK
jgi:hypothetical protein